MKLFAERYARLIELEQGLADYEAKIARIFAKSPLCQRLAKIKTFPDGSEMPEQFTQPGYGIRGRF